MVVVCDVAQKSSKGPFNVNRNTNIQNKSTIKLTRQTFAQATVVIAGIVVRICRYGGGRTHNGGFI